MLMKVLLLVATAVIFTVDGNKNQAIRRLRMFHTPELKHRSLNAVQEQGNATSGTHKPTEDKQQNGNVGTENPVNPNAKAGNNSSVVSLSNKQVVAELYQILGAVIHDINDIESSNKTLHDVTSLQPLLMNALRRENSSLLRLADHVKDDQKTVDLVSYALMSDKKFLQSIKPELVDKDKNNVTHVFGALTMGIMNVLKESISSVLSSSKNTTEPPQVTSPDTNTGTNKTVEVTQQTSNATVSTPVEVKQQTAKADTTPGKVQQEKPKAVTNSTA